MQRRKFVKDTVMVAGAVAATGVLSGNVLAADTDLPVVWHWRKCSPENLLQALAKVRDTSSAR